MKKGVLITGGTSGIGLAAAVRFSRRNDHVVLLGRDKARGEAATQQVMALSGSRNCYYVQGDVSRLEDCRRAVQSTVELCGTIDYLVNSAGVYLEKSLDDMSEDDFARIIDINLKGTYFMTQQAVLFMKKQGSGSIVNISSDAGVHGNLLCSAYCASKGAVNLFSRAMALELAPWNVRINSICPGDVMTPLTDRQLDQYPDKELAIKEMCSVYPMGRIAAADEIAAVVEFLCSDSAAFVNGAVWSVDGGLTS
ncbi:MAG: SDR family oxidoreductase [Anaerovibrio sp.]|uniref:SDR family NAD(P)-dependent oxidoreductase n=1 Tax=Anaerovibrio sp. TaxID=1872532 RepID=UPI0025DF0DC5|nr:SDR family oxidoreductase [Anaerovibrio sp.]MCR5176603.1 SDR family oxidoreductase [Anaerovibrio sp.]